MLQTNTVRHRGAPTSSTAGKIWDPANEQQYIEPDTLFLLDPDAEASKTPGVDGLMLAATVAGNTIWQADSKVITAAGKFRTGIKTNTSHSDASRGYLWTRSEGYLPPDEFTIEFWLRCDTDWANLTASQNFMAIGDTTNSTVFVKINFTYAVSGLNNNSSLTVSYQHSQGDGAGGLTVSKSATSQIRTAFPAAGLSWPLANTWHNLAVTYKSQVMTIYFDGVQVGQRTAIYPARYFGCVGGSDGLSILGWKTTNTAPHFTISDLRISRQARVPLAPIIPSGSNIITVNKDVTTGATIQQGLRGGLHPFTYDYPNAEAYARANMSVIRTDGLLTVTPIKIGGAGVSADTTYPTAGYTKTDGINPDYYYDWQVVDRDLNYIVNNLGLEPYISVDATPQLFGGTFPPFTGTALTSTLPYNLSTRFPSYTWAKQSPTNSGSLGIPGSASSSTADYSNYANIVKDLVYHITVEKGYSVPYWGIWNEPDGNFFWGSTRADYLNMYGALAPAIKTINASLKVGGPDSAHYNGSTFPQAIMQYCGTLPAANNFKGTAQASGGTFTAGTYWGKVVAYNGIGNSLGSTAASATVVNNGSILWSWGTNVTGATSYNVYRSTTSGGLSTSPALVGTVDGNTLNFTDTGASPSAGSVPSSAVANNVPLDFVSWHYYFTNIGEIYDASNAVSVNTSLYSLPSTPEIIVGEGNFTASSLPMSNYPYGINDWTAAFMASSLIAMQSIGAVKNIYAWTIRDPGDSLGRSTGLIGPSYPYPQLNVYGIWKNMAGNVVTTTIQADPGISVVASTNGSGKITVLISSFHITGSDQVVSVLIPGLSSSATVTSYYIIDSAHSNITDAGSSHQELETTTPPIISGQINIIAKARSVHMLVIQ